MSVQLRAALVTTLAPRLDEPGVLTLVGPGGTGKTTLARRLLNERGPLVRCARATSEGEVLRRLADAVQVSLRGPVEGDIGRIGRALDGRPVGLDELEHLSGIGARVAGLLVEEGVPVLCTSRVPLDLDGEVVERLEAPPMDELLRLFFEGADAVTVEPCRDEAIVRALVEELGRNPLAVEIAAGHTALATPAQLLERLRKTRDLVALEGDRPAKHTSLLALVAHTWELLDAPARDALRRLGAFAGSFTAASAVELGCSPRQLETLRRWSLLLRRVHSVVRFELAPEVRLFIEAEAPPTEPQLRAHAELLIGRSEPRVRCIGEKGHREALEALAADYRDLVAVVDRTGLPDALRARAQRVAVRYLLALHTGLALELLDRARPVAGEPETGLALVVSRSRALRRRHRVQQAFDGLQSLELDLGPADRGTLLVERAACLSSLGRLAESLEEARTAVAIAEEAGGRVLATALLQLTKCSRMVGESERAAAACGRGVRVARSGGFHDVEIQLRLQQLLMGESLGYTVAVRAHARARELADVLGDQALLALVDCYYVSILLWWGRAVEAEPHVKRALDGLERIGHRQAHLNLRCNHALVRAAAVPPAEARARLLELQAETRTVESHQYETDLLLGLGVCAHREGDLEAAGQAYRQAAEVGEARQRQSRFWAQRLLALLDAEAGTRVDTDDPVVALAAEVWAGSAEPAALQAAIAEDPTVAGHGRAYRDVIARRALSAVPCWRFQADGRAFELPRGDVVDLGRRKAPRRILAELVEARVSAPGSHLDADALIAAGWPGQRILPHAARNRLWAAVKDLRALGLEPVLQTVDEGYRIDPAVGVERVEALGRS